MWAVHSNVFVHGRVYLAKRTEHGTTLAPGPSLRIHQIHQHRHLLAPAHTNESDQPMSRSGKPECSNVVDDQSYFPM